MEKQAMNFAINCQWLGQDVDSAQGHALCRLEIRAGENILTRNREESSGNVEDSVVVSAWPLAGNWWRILYETGHSHEARPSLDWERSHYLPAADYGYLWPHIHFVSDGEFVRIQMAPDPGDDIRLARYIGNFRDILVPRGEFASVAENFLREVDSRLADRYADDDLRGLVAQLLEEIGDEGFAEYREIEAMTGYDPDEAPDDVIRYGGAIIRQYGQEFFNAMASAVNRSFANGTRSAESLESIYKAAGEVGRHGIRAKFALGNEVALKKPGLAAPWAYGRALARSLRGQIALDPEKRLETSTLRDWFELGEYEFRNGQICGASGICHKEGDVLRFRFADESSLQYGRNRRFFLSRLAGACLDGPSPWLAIGPGATWDQKMQRAFAAELVAPIGAIRAMIPKRGLSRRDVEKIADHFDASLYTIVHSLANHNVISRAEAAALAA